MQEKKDFIQSIKDHFYEKKLQKNLAAALENHSNLTQKAANPSEVKNSEDTVRTAFVTLAEKSFPNLSYLNAGKVFDRIAFFAKHEKEFENLKAPEAKDYPNDRLTKEDVEDMRKIYGFSHAYEGTIYRELNPDERKGYRATLMGTGQIAGYVGDPEFRSLASNIIDMKKQSLAAESKSAALNQAMQNQSR
ncbi:MAG: hypothetical protein AB7U85_01105 [Alphaproteobacteria bacterium]